MKVLISRKTGKYYYFNGVGDLHCKEGVVKNEDINSGELIVKSHMGKELLVFDANPYDVRQKFSRGPQIITDKDLGYIISKSGITKNSIIVEAGGGSGVATCFFSQIAKKVRTYEIREDHIEVINKNLELIEAKNVKLIKADINKKISKEKDFDMLFLDLPDHHKVVEKDILGLKKGHFIVCYVPSITQVLDITNVISNRKDLYLEEISETNVRNWKAWGQVARPHHRKETDFTAFLVFIRKL